MRQIIGRWVKGTPLEGLARRLAGAGPAAAAPEVDRNTLYDRQTAEIIRRVLDRRSNCIDVGCHQGAILDDMLRAAPEGRHFAFEPLPDLFAALARKYAGVPNVVLHELALSDAPGEATFQHVVSNPGYSGLLRRHYDRPDEQVVEIHVRLARMDDVVPADAPIRLVKIDVEGAELQVLQGATGLLRRCRPFVVFEHGKGAADCYGTTPQQVFDLFADCGLSLSLMGDWLEAGDRRRLSRAAFVEQFEECRNYYFLAHPSAA